MSNEFYEGGFGIVRTYGSKLVDLDDPKPEMIDILDVAWGLGRQIRFNGHIKHDHTVAHHSIIMSYLVPEKYALEALLHDASESYIGDIVHPVKRMFPEVAELEDRLLHIIMEKYGVVHQTVQMGGGEPSYVKHPSVMEADLKCYQHEAYGFGRKGKWHQDVEDAWLEAAKAHEDYWQSPMYAFLQRFNMLTGVENPMDLDLDEITRVWFPEDWQAEQAMKEAETTPIEEMDAYLDEIEKKEEEKKDES